jgi:hypothetical protein
VNFTEGKISIFNEYAVNGWLKIDPLIGGRQHLVFALTATNNSVTELINYEDRVLAMYIQKDQVYIYT